MARIEEATVDVDGVEVFYRRIAGDGPPVVFVHGNPTSSEDWIPFLERTRSSAIALDLPGWGRSGRPRGFDYSMHGLAGSFARFLDALDVREHWLVVHDWGALALIAAQRDPARLRRLVIINAVPLLPGYRWHWVARIWRRRGLGELWNATSTRASFAIGLRQARADRGAMPEAFVDAIWRHWDAGTKRAILELYRSADPPTLAAAGERLGTLDCPALVLWGERDPYLPSRFGTAYAQRLPNAELVAVPGAGHWPWIERHDLVHRVVSFLDR